MSTYFVEYDLSTDRKTHCFFAKSEKPEEQARETIINGLKKAYGESLSNIEITKQNSEVRQ